MDLAFDDKEDSQAGESRLDGIICMDLESGFMNASGQHE